MVSWTVYDKESFWLMFSYHNASPCVPQATLNSPVYLWALYAPCGFLMTRVSHHPPNLIGTLNSIQTIHSYHHKEDIGSII